MGLCDMTVATKSEKKWTRYYGNFERYTVKNN